MGRAASWMGTVTWADVKASAPQHRGPVDDHRDGGVLINRNRLADKKPLAVGCHAELIEDGFDRDFRLKKHVRFAGRDDRAGFDINGHDLTVEA
jgi:hypothetical protein